MLALTTEIRHTSAPTITAISDAGIFLKIFGQTIRIASPRSPTPNAQKLKVEKSLEPFYLYLMFVQQLPFQLCGNGYLIIIMEF